MHFLCKLSQSPPSMLVYVVHECAPHISKREAAEKPSSSMLALVSSSHLQLIALDGNDQRLRFRKVQKTRLREVEAKLNHWHRLLHPNGWWFSSPIPLTKKADT